MEESGQGENSWGRGGNSPAQLPSSVSLFGILCLKCALTCSRLLLFQVRWWRRVRASEEVQVFLARMPTRSEALADATSQLERSDADH